ncbi:MULTISPECIES: MFS transporter [unclassified Curtobacterium]|uniref:MFS transporter n=1 Tax=unclassified Curtobacterium TaxID=257496 RepID=UPI0037FA378A
MAKDTTGNAHGQLPVPAATAEEEGSVPPEPSKIWNRAFIAIFATNVLVSIGLQMSNVLIGKYTDSLGATAAVVGIVSSAFAWSAIVFKLASAPALDAFNRKFIVLGAIIAIGVAFLGFGISGNVPELITFRLLQGAGQAFSTTAFIAMAADALPRERIGTGLGFFTLGAGVAQMVGPVISLKVAAAGSYDTAFFIAAGFVGLGVVMCTQIKLTYKRPKGFTLSPKNFFAKEVLLAAIITFFVFACYSLVNPFLAIFAGQQGVGSNISFFFTIYAGVLFVSRPLAGRLADRFGYLVLVPMMVLFIGSFFLISVSHSLLAFLVAAVLFGFGYGGCQPVLQSMAMKMVPRERRGAGSTTNFLGSDLGNIVGPIVGGSIATTFGYTAMWQGMTVALVISGVLVVVLRRAIVRQIDSVVTA